MTTTGGGARPLLRLLPPLLLLLLLLPPPTSASASGTATEPKPTVELSRQRVPRGAEITVSGSGWRPRALLMLLVCGQNMIGGTNACANDQGRAVTTDARGAFGARLPVPGPPKPCPCVVHIATVTGDRAAANAPLTIAGHPAAPLPRPAGGRLVVLAATRLEGESGLLVRFGAPPSRRLVLTIGNLGPATARNPVFEVGSAHGVYAPHWAPRPWRGTIEPGKKALVELPVELPAGAHGDYEISVRHDTQVIAKHPWPVPRPWGVVAFWSLLALVAPITLFRASMTLINHIRPHPPKPSHQATDPHPPPETYPPIRFSAPRPDGPAQS